MTGIYRFINHAVRLRLMYHNRIWSLNDQAHSFADIPAVQLAYSYDGWYWHGNRHRAHGLPAIIWLNGAVEYYMYGIKVNQDESIS